MPILLTGFAPFDGEHINPSWEAVRGFDGREIAGHRIDVQRLPVEFHTAREHLREALLARRYAAVLCIGQAGGRSSISLERVAINLADARMADNANYQPQMQPLIAGAPNAYFAPCRLESALAALHAASIPAEISLSAGSFVCNDVFFGLCHFHATEQASLRGTFVHIPYAPQQVLQRPLPSMPIEMVQRAIEVLIEGLAAE